MLKIFRDYFKNSLDHEETDKNIEKGFELANLFHTWVSIVHL